MPELNERRRERLIAAACLHRALAIVDSDDPDPVMVRWRTEEVWTLLDSILGDDEFWYEREESLQAQAAEAIDAVAEAAQLQAIRHESVQLGTALAEAAARRNWTVADHPAP